MDLNKTKPPQSKNPGGPVVKNLLFNAGDESLIPGWGTKIPHATGQLCPCATTREAVPCNERSRVPQLRPDAVKQINNILRKKS